MSTARIISHLKKSPNKDNFYIISDKNTSETLQFNSSLSLGVSQISDNQQVDSAQSVSDFQISVPASTDKFQNTAFLNQTYKDQFLEISTNYSENYLSSNNHNVVSITEPPNTEFEHACNEAYIDNNTSDSVVFVAERAQEDNIYQAAAATPRHLPNIYQLPSTLQGNDDLIKNVPIFPPTSSDISSQIFNTQAEAPVSQPERSTPNPYDLYEDISDPEEIGNKIDSKNVSEIKRFKQKLKCF